MTTVGRLARRYGVSRSTLLYYHRIGILCPSGHRQGDYRNYTGADEERLRRILGLRNAGLKLEEIKAVLDDKAADDLSAVLERRLLEMNDEIDALKAQQRLTATLLGAHRTAAGDKEMTKTRWVAMLAAAGFTEADMSRWHREFEASDPETHEAFLRALGISQEEADRIRTWASRD